MSRRSLEEEAKGPENVKWVKLVGKFHAIVEGKKIVIKPGDVFKAPADKFRNDSTWKRVEEKKEEAVAPKRNVPQEPGVKFRKILVGDDQFDVVRADGKLINKKPLTEKEADAILDGK